MAVRSGAGTVARRSPIRKVAALRPRDWWVLCRVLFWIAIVRVVSLARGFGGTARVLRLRPVDPVEPSHAEQPVLDARARRALHVATRLADRRWMRVTCLPRSIALLRVLAAHGVDADLVLGCVTDDGFKAHAWVELDGYPIYEYQRGAAWHRLARFRRVEE